jgi:hypothetical protein
MLGICDEYFVVYTVVNLSDRREIQHSRCLQVVWDKISRVWTVTKCVLVLQGQEACIWDLAEMGKLESRNA